ncbi:MAG: condensation domain-containing protein, partial [Porcipelethomonas sp.]
IQFLDRVDQQVKIRGFRIELTEVEEVICRYPDISDATVAAFDNPAGGKYIAAYICSDQKIDINSLNNFIRSEKPPYMVPAVTMQIDAIPYNQNLKVNKRALPEPDFSPANKESTDSRPLTALEERIASAAESSVGIKITDVSTPLIDMGVTSLSAISFVTRLGKEIGVNISVKKILGGYNLIDIENEIVNQLLTRTATEEKTDEIQDKYPITQTQFGIYSECIMYPGKTTYNIPYSYRLEKATGSQRLADALAKVVNAHSPLKCTVEADENGDIYMIPHSDSDAEIKVHKGSESEAEEYFRNFVRPFDFGSELYRITVFETDEYIYLYTDFHHIIFDGESVGVFLRDLDSALAGNDLNEEKSVFILSLEEKKALASAEFTKAKDYYDNLMKGCPGCTLPDPDRNEETDKEGFECISRSELSVAEVSDYCQKHGVTPNAFFLAAAGLLLGRYAYTDDVCFTTVYNGRNGGNTANAVGMFVKTLPLRCFTEDEKNTADYIMETSRQLLANMSNDLYSFAQVSRTYGVSADYMLVYQGEGFGPDTIDGRPVTSHSVPLGTAKSDISTDVWIKDGIYVFETEYRSNKYSREFIERYTDMLATAAKSMLTAQTLAQVNITSEEQLALINSFNDTDYPVKLVSVNKLFEKHAKANPDMTAVIANGEKLAYGELNCLANRLAHSLGDMELGREDVVGIVLDRTKEVYICEYGILKSGGAFLPLSNEYPDDRIDFCLTDAECRFVITTEKIKAERGELFSGDKPYKVLTVEQLTNHCDDSDPDLDIPSDSLAYCIYTSGSTGKPKGVMIEHGNLCNFVDANEKNDETRNIKFTRNYTKHA